MNGEKLKYENKISTGTAGTAHENPKCTSTGLIGHGGTLSSTAERDVLQIINNITIARATIYTSVSVRIIISVFVYTRCSHPRYHTPDKRILFMYISLYTFFHNNNVFIERDKKKKNNNNNSNTFARTLGHGAAFGFRRPW